MKGGADRAAEGNPELTDSQHWIDSYGDVKFVAYDANNEHFRLLFRYVNPERLDSALEIGSYPGPFLAALGPFGCELNGVDIHPDNSERLAGWLHDLGFRVGELCTENFWDFAPGRKYDLVYSLGFLEHFRNYEMVIRRHAQLVKREGYLFLTAPNFAGVVQRWLHYLLDRKNLEKHYLPSMNPTRWKTILEEEGFDVRYAGYFGNIGFWVDHRAPRSRLNRIISRAVVRLFWNVKKAYKGNSRAFSIYCGLVAVKTR